MEEWFKRSGIWSHPAVQRIPRSRQGHVAPCLPRASQPQDEGGQSGRYTLALPVGRRGRGGAGGRRGLCRMEVLGRGPSPKQALRSPSHLTWLYHPWGDRVGLAVLAGRAVSPGRWLCLRPGQVPLSSGGASLSPLQLPLKHPEASPQHRRSLGSQPWASGPGSQPPGQAGLLGVMEDKARSRRATPRETGGLRSQGLPSL